MYFHYKLRYLAKATITTRLKNEKCFSNEKNLIQAIKIMVPQQCYRQRDFHNSCPHSVSPRLEFHCQFPLSLVH